MLYSFFFRVCWIFLKCIMNNGVITLLRHFLCVKESFSLQLQEFLLYFLYLRTVSRSSTISLRSIDTTSPVSSSTKSSYQVLSTRAANFRPKYFFNPDFDTFTSSAKVKNFKNIFITLKTNSSKQCGYR